MWRFRGLLQRDDWLYPLAAIFGASVGVALLVAISVEVTGKLVLLIPAAVKKIKDSGHEEGRQEQLDRLEEAYKRFGIEVNGVLTLPRTPEVEEFLSGKSDGKL